MARLPASYAQPAGRRGIPVRLILAVVVVGFALFKYWGSFQANPVTGRNQPIPISREQEIALGMNAAPEMAQQFGGLSPDPKHRTLVESVGAEIVAALPKEAKLEDGTLPYPFQYHCLAEPQTVNAFALPGGQIFITDALLGRLETRGQLAGVLGHETGHVLGRHSAQQMAKAELIQGVATGATVAASDTYNHAQAARAAAATVANFLQLKYSRTDEYEADQLGLRFMVLAGYDPRSMIRVMEILRQASGGGPRSPEFASTHPDPGNRIQRIEEWIKENYPQGVPAGLKQ